MRVYFLSYVPAILKLNGIYAGCVDLFERHLELELGDNVLAEIIPGDNLQPINFFINEKLLSAPPPYLKIYLIGNETLIFVQEYAAKNAVLKVILQTMFHGNLITVFSQGAVYLSSEGAGYNLSPLPSVFSAAAAKEVNLCGFPVLEIRAENHVVLLGADGKKIFYGEVLKIEYGNRLTVWTAFETCSAARAESVYLYDSKQLTLESSQTVETMPPSTDILHFAFFESVLTRGDIKKYLSDELSAVSDKLSEYLGEFAEVAIPTQKFYAEHENMQAAGLCYRKSENLFEVKYFAVELTEGKISNIFPVE